VSALPAAIGGGPCRSSLEPQRWAARSRPDVGESAAADESVALWALALEGDHCTHARAVRIAAHDLGERQRKRCVGQGIDGAH